MYREYIDNQEDLINRPRLIVGTAFLLAIDAILGMLCVAALLGAPVLGILMVVIWVVLLAKAIKNIHELSEISKRTNAYILSTHKPSLTIKRNTTYCFVVPFSTTDSIEVISTALKVMGKIRSTDSARGVVRGLFHISPKDNIPVDFYIERSESECKVRACFIRVANDDWWDLFLHILFEQNPGVNFGVEQADGVPLIAGVLNLNGDTKQVSFSQTSGGTSLGGFLVGGALFGDAGAIVGGLSGRQRTMTNSKTVFSNELLVRVIYSNGRLWEGTVVKGSQLYNEIMVNMK